MKALILSAGLGTRLKPLTDKSPKVMVEIAGKPILEHLICLCRRHGVGEVVVNVHYLPHVIKNYFGDGSKWGIKIHYSDETKQIMGGAGAIKLAQSWLKDDDFAVLNGDVVTNVDLTAMLKFHRQKQALGTFLVHQTDHPYDSDLVETDTGSRITKFFRPRSGDKFKPVSKTGTHIFNPRVIDFIPANRVYSLEHDLIPTLLKLGEPLYAYTDDCYSKDIGTKIRLEAARKDYDMGIFTLPQ